MLTIDIDVIRVTLHVLAATIWVGGQIVLAALVGPLRRTAPESVAVAARAFAWVAWPAYGVLIVTGMWNLSAAGPVGEAYQMTVMVKLLLVVLSGLGAALHTFAKKPALKGFWGTVGLVSAVGTLVLGVSMA